LRAWGGVAFLSKNVQHQSAMTSNKNWKGMLWSIYL